MMIRPVCSRATRTIECKSSGIRFAAFTRPNEILVGRTAMLGFTASVIGEHLTGMGPLNQLAKETGFSTPQIASVLLATTLATSVLALRPGASSAEGVTELGPLQDPRITILDPKSFFGVTDFGFTPQNELFVGRMANLGFLMATLGEWYTGKGALAQLQSETHLPVMDLEFGIAFMAIFTLFAALGPKNT